jgi:hypothetical protein
MNMGRQLTPPDRVRHTGSWLTAKPQLLEYGEVNHVQSLNSTALPDLWKIDVSGYTNRKTIRDLCQEYAHGVNGKEPLRKKERRRKKWRQDPIDPKTGK